MNVGLESSETAGTRWLGEVPSHWRISRLKNVADYWVSNVDKVPAEGEEPVRLCNYTDVYYNEHLHPNLNLMRTTATAAEIRRFHLQIGDVVITKDSEEWSDIAVPALVTDTAPDLVCGYHLAIVRPRPNRLHGPFLQRLFQAAGVNTQLQLSASGITRYSLPKSAIGGAVIPLPPMGEQRLIANFLDRETGSIEKLIDTKERLVVALAHERATLITSHVFGQDLPCTRKESGNRYMPAVPERWDIVQLRRCITISEGQVNPEDARYKDRVLIAPNHIESGTGRILYTETATEQAAISGKYRVRAGDLIYSKIRPALNKVCIANGDCLCSADMYPISPRPGMRSDYLFYVMLSAPFVQLVTDESMRVAMPKVNRPTLMSIRVPRPSLPEQEAIAEVLRRKLSQLTALSARTQRSIEKLEEYRLALVSAAVTGQIDVRNYRPQEASALCQ